MNERRPEQSRNKNALDREQIFIEHNASLCVKKSGSIRFLFVCKKHNTLFGGIKWPELHGASRKGEISSADVKYSESIAEEELKLCVAKEIGTRLPSIDEKKSEGEEF